MGISFEKPARFLTPYPYLLCMLSNFAYFLSYAKTVQISARSSIKRGFTQVTNFINSFSHGNVYL